MSSLEKLPLRTFTTFVEDDAGVIECIVGVFDEGSQYAMHPLAARVVSGTFEKLSSERLQRAIEMHHWAEKNPIVFAEGRVAPQD